MKDFRYIKKALDQKWYTQRFNGVPIFSNITTLSGFAMKKELGYGYSSFLFSFAVGCGEMNYLKTDLKKLWVIIKKKIKENTSYLLQLRKKYRDTFHKYETLFREIDNLDFKNIDHYELLRILREVAMAQSDAMGLAHILESIGLGIEKEFKSQLRKELNNEKKYNELYALLIQPSHISFLGQEEK